MTLVRFSEHALAKLDVLAVHGWRLSVEQVEAVVREPERIDVGYKGRKIAQKGLDAGHVLRVVFEELSDSVVIVTMYPGRRERYDKD